ncbi:MAG: NAD(P)/FAD-dependent oxidoreductase [Thermoleophilia bacterium]|nr:NAD(P)/FAD-dependent oxidoreductase [Thermoleophilia bacterium]
MPTGIHPLDALLSPAAAGSTRRRVVVIGGGFAGLRTVRALRDAPVEVTLVDRRNFHLFQPLLYQVATGALSAGEIAAPLRAVLRRQANARVVLGEVDDVDLAGRRVVLRPLEAGAATALAYDDLVVAAGGGTTYFGNDAWEPLAPGLKTVEDALELRRRILVAFEAAEREDDPAVQREWLTFAVVGAGPTGVEMAGQIVEMARDTLRRDFRRIDPSTARVLLVEAAPAVLPGYAAGLRARAGRDLAGHGVELLLQRMVVELTAREIAVRDPDGRVERIATRTVIWGAGVRASALGERLAAAAGVDVDRGGRIPVERDFSLPGHPEVFVVGDMARVEGPGGAPLPGIAPVAMQEGSHVGRVIATSAAGRPGPAAFRYHDKGSLATIGRARAVGTVFGLPLTGLPAWLAWLGIHLTYLIGFQNRLFVFMRWSISFLTRGRGARLINEPWDATGAVAAATADEDRREVAPAGRRGAS